MSTIKTYSFTAPRILRETGYFCVQADSLEAALITSNSVSPTEWEYREVTATELPVQFLDLED